MAQALTYAQVISILEDIARRSYKINSFFLGRDWELAQSEAPTYPVLQVYPLSSTMPISVMGDYKSVIFEIQCKLLDLVGQDQFNQKNVHNDLQAVAQSIVNELNQNPYFVRSSVKLVGDIDFINLEEINDDFLAGWEWVIRLEVRNINTFCGQAFEPVDGFSMSGPVSSGYSPSIQYLTCETVTGCSTLDLFIEQKIDEALTGVTSDNFYTTGGTLIGTVVHFDRTDTLDAYQVQLSGLTSGITATGAYLNLSGGTVTGNTTFQSNVTVTGITESGTFKVTTFNPTNPQIYADADTNTGIMFDGPDILSLHTGGFQRLLINSSGQITNGSQLAGTGWETYLSGDTRVDLISATTLSATTAWVYNDPWTIELINSTTVDFYAPYAMSINSYTNILGSPFISLKDDGAAYTTGTTIAIGSKISVSGSTTGVTILNAIRL